MKWWCALVGQGDAGDVSPLLAVRDQDKMMRQERHINCGFACCKQLSAATCCVYTSKKSQRQWQLYAQCRHRPTLGVTCGPTDVHACVCAHLTAATSPAFLLCTQKAPSTDTPQKATMKPSPPPPPPPKLFVTTHQQPSSAKLASHSTCLNNRLVHSLSAKRVAELRAASSLTCTPPL